MNWLSDEMLFYGGMIFAVCSLVLAIIYFCISQIRMVTLKAHMDAEYGEEKKLRKKK